jgi:ABC-2 type transport system ATP-binding protein
MLHVAHLTKHYRSFVALDDVTFDIPRGQTAAVVGPNGAGKSTLIRMLAGFLAPTHGTASIGGFDVQRNRLAAAALTGYLPENVPLYPDMTARESLRFFGAARGLRGERLTARIDAVVSACSLEALLHARVGALSRGQRQRVGIAQALLHDPPFVVLDEPTSGLDPNQARQFRDALRAMRADKTIVISTHLLSDLPTTVERVLLIHAGRLVFDGTPATFAGAESIDAAFWRLTGGAVEQADTVGSRPQA